MADEPRDLDAFLGRIVISSELVLRYLYRRVLPSLHGMSVEAILLIAMLTRVENTKLWKLCSFKLMIHVMNQK